MSGIRGTRYGVTCRTADAQLAKGVLDDIGVQSLLRSDNGGGMYPALDSADLLVRAEDVEKANDALRRE